MSCTDESILLIVGKVQVLVLEVATDDGPTHKGERGVHGTSIHRLIYGWDV